MGLDPQAEERRVAVEGLGRGEAAELGDLGRGQDGVADQPGLAALADELDGIAHRDDGQHLDWLG